MTDKEFLNHMAVVSALIGDRLIVEICRVIVKRDLSFVIREDNLDVYGIGYVHNVLCRLKLKDKDQYRIMRSYEEGPEHIGYSFKLTHIMELIDFKSKKEIKCKS